MRRCFVQNSSYVYGECNCLGHRLEVKFRINRIRKDEWPVSKSKRKQPKTLFPGSRFWSYYNRRSMCEDRLSNLEETLTIPEEPINYVYRINCVGFVWTIKDVVLSFRQRWCLRSKDICCEGWMVGELSILNFTVNTYKMWLNCIYSINSHTIPHLCRPGSPSKVFWHQERLKFYF